MPDLFNQPFNVGLSVAAFAILLPLASVVCHADEGVRRSFRVETPMRDEVKLVSDIWMPAESGRYPTILLRSPYERNLSVVPNNRPPEYGAYFARHGYVFMIQDTRGRGDSEGSFSFFQDDGEDGFDTIEWIAQQPWSDGAVCTMGVSYLGTVQWLAAAQAPPALKCMASTAAAGRWFEELPYLGGALALQFILPWTNGTSGRIQQSANAAGMDPERVFRHRPLLTMDEATFGTTIKTWRNFLKHDTFDEYWKNIYLRAPDDFESLDLPVLHITGLFDWDQPGAMRYWRSMRAWSPAREDQFLILGPWTHPQTWTGGKTSLGKWQLGETGILDYKPIHLAFFDRYLKGKQDVQIWPRARIFVTGANIWQELSEYPPATLAVKRLYLQTSPTGLGAHAINGSGRLTWSQPGEQLPDRFSYDPADPTPSSIGWEDPRGIDHRPIEEREDVLVYTSEAFVEPTTIMGAAVVNLWAASDARDTDFVVKLLDVAPDGTALKLGPTEVGVLRARYRNGFEQIELLQPGQIEHYEIPLFDTAHRFLTGHRIRLEVASSAFPFIDANTNTGNRPATDTDWVIANQAVYHDQAHPSHIELPIVPTAE